MPTSSIHSDDLQAQNLSKWKNMPSAYRNIVAWYLRAAGVSFKKIGVFLSLSSTRVSTLVTKVRQLVYSKNRIRQWDIENAGAKESLSAEAFKNHALKQWHKEMVDAEYILSNLSLLEIEGDHFVISEALRLGRKVYSDAVERPA